MIQLRSILRKTEFSVLKCIKKMVTSKKVSVLLCFVLFFVIAGLVTASISKEEEEEVGIYELKNGDMSVKLTNWGAGLISLFVPDKHGKLEDIALGYGSVKEYMNDTAYLGAIVGRVANRIAGAKFSLNGTQYKLVPNEGGKNMLHGGLKGFSDVVWKVSKYLKDGHSPHVVFTYHSRDGEEGFPGDLYVTVSYTLLKPYTLKVTMKAKAQNKPTPVNLAQHTYWNIGGHNSGTVLGHKVQIFASQYTPVDENLIPTGKFASVKNTPYDFLKPRIVGSRINKLPTGYDINYVIDKVEKGKNIITKAAIVYDEKSGRVMELYTNAPGVQFYTANYLKDTKGKDGCVYEPHDGLCLETQGFPDAVNHPNFPSQIVTPDKPYKHVMLFKFSTKS